MRKSDYDIRRSALFLVMAMIIVMFLSPSCNDGNGCIDGSGGTVLVELDLAPFHSILTESSFEVRIEQGPEQSVVVEGKQNIISDITTEVSDGIWLISLTGDCYNDLDIVINIIIPTLKLIESTGADRVILNSFDSLDQVQILVSGSGRFFQSGVLDISDQLTIQSTGSGEMTANFNSALLNVLVSGSGNVNLSGTTDAQTISMTGSGSYFAFDMTSNSCIIDNSGAGNAEVSVENELDVKISGSGNVSYKGDPSITSSLTGSGKLIDAN